MKTFEQMTTKDNHPEWIIVHHTGSRFDSSNQTFKMVQDYHLSLGWENFGYHYFIDKQGKVQKGRPEHYHGAHTRNHNTDSIGICLAGNFDITLPTGSQEFALKDLLKELVKEYSIKKEKIIPHRKFTFFKTCFGKRLSNDWARNLLEEEEMVCLPKKLLEPLKKYI